MAGGGLQKTRRPKQTDAERELPSSLFPRQQPGALRSLGAPGSREPSAPPPPSQSACWSARCPLPAARHRHRAGQGSHRSLELPPSSLSLTSFCSACAKPIWNCLNPNIQPPPPPSQIPPQFKTSPALALRGGREGAPGREARGRLVRGGSSFLFNFWGARGGGGGGIGPWPSLSLGHRSISAHFSH